MSENKNPPFQPNQTDGSENKPDTWVYEATLDDEGDSNVIIKKAPDEETVSVSQDSMDALEGAVVNQGVLPKMEPREVDITSKDTIPLTKFREEVYKNRRTRTRVDSFESDIQDNQEEIDRALSRIDELGVSINDAERAVEDLKSVTNELEPGVSSLEERVTSVEETISNVESQMQSNQINLHTVDLIYRGTMVTGAIASLVAAVALAFAYQLVTVFIVLVLTAGFFIWSYRRGIQIDNA